jgi:hypothetical protein
MKKILLAVALLMGIGLTTPMSAAAHSSVSFGFWFPGVSLFVGPPAPVYYAPPVYAPPVYYPYAPVYAPYGPVYAPGAVVVGGHGWGYGHRYYGGGYRHVGYGRGRGHWHH